MRAVSGGDRIGRLSRSGVPLVEWAVAVGRSGSSYSGSLLIGRSGREIGSVAKCGSRSGFRCLSRLSRRRSDWRCERFAVPFGW